MVCGGGPAGSSQLVRAVCLGLVAELESTGDLLRLEIYGPYLIPRRCRRPFVSAGVAR